MYNYFNASSLSIAYCISFYSWKCIVVDKLWECIFYMNWQIWPRFLMIRKTRVRSEFLNYLQQEYFIKNIQNLQKVCIAVNLSDYPLNLSKRIIIIKKNHLEGASASTEILLTSRNHLYGAPSSRIYTRQFGIWFGISLSWLSMFQAFIYKKQIPWNCI